MLIPTPIYAAFFINRVEDAAAARAGAHAFHVGQNPAFEETPEQLQAYRASPSGHAPATHNFCCRPIIVDEFERAKAFAKLHDVPLEMAITKETLDVRPLAECEAAFLSACDPPLKRIV